MPSLNVFYPVFRSAKGYLQNEQINIQINGKPVFIQVETDYPFRMHAKIIIEVQEPIDFEILFRIPAWVKNLKLNEKTIRVHQGHFSLHRNWQGTEILYLSMEAIPTLKRRTQGLRVLTYGPLIFALPIKTDYRKKEYIKNEVERNFPYCDFELIPSSVWRFGFACHMFTVEERPVNDVPFSSQHPPLVIHAQMARVAWSWADGYDTVPSAKPDSHKAVGAKEEKLLIPYGCAKLRMTELPFVCN